MKRISVCIPVYNPGPYLKVAIDSVLAQSFTDFELVVVDDASTEPVETIVTCYSDMRMQFHRNQSNLGLVGNWNRCLALASGEYITIFHQDDLMQPDNLAAKVAMLDANPNVGFVYSNIETMDSGGRITGGHWLPQLPEDTIESGRECFERLAVLGNFISCPSVMVRAECYQTLGKFDARLPFTCDLEMWMRIAGRYDVGYLAAPLVASRVHAGQETARFSGAGSEIREVRKALEIAFKEHAPAGISPDLHRAARRSLIAWAYRMGRWRLGQHRWRSALGYFAAGGGALLSGFD
jgi:glycosyltransferase involved in cell wall biosynthesis